MLPLSIYLHFFYLLELSPVNLRVAVLLSVLGDKSHIIYRLYSPEQYPLNYNSFTYCSSIWHSELNME